jgi:predicted nucleic acid-binding Zn ribbon protein
MKAEINASNLCKEITMQVSVRGLRRFRIRMTIVMVLLRVIAWIAPFGVEINEE